MADVVKTPLNVTFHCSYSLVGKFIPGIDYIDNIPDFVLVCPVGAEAIAVRIKSRFAYRLYDKPHTFLYDSVQYRRDSQRPHFAVAFENVFPAGRFGLVFTKTRLNQ